MRATAVDTGSLKLLRDFDGSPPLHALSEPIVPSTLVPAAKPEPVLLNSDVIPGIFLDRRECRKYMRDKLAEHDISAEVADVKPQRHDKYFSFKGICLRCPDRKAAVVYSGTNYRKSVGIPEETFRIVSQGVHVHDEHNTSDSARVFFPRQEKLAHEYLASTRLGHRKASPIT